MKITEVKTYVVGNPWKNWVFVKLFTDEGITGIGEATGSLSAMPIVEQIKELGRFYIGMDPLNPGRIYDRMYKGLFLVNNSAMGAIETACWDVIGKKYGIPIWQMLGGKYHDKLRVYANGWYKGPRDPLFFAERASQLVEMGYTAMKFDPFGKAYRFTDPADEKLSLRIIRAVRKAVGDKADLLIEGHDRFSVSTAIRIGNALEEFEPMCFETPVMSTDISALVAVAKAIKVPVATGEKFHRKDEFADLLHHRVIDIIQPETLDVGGIAETKKICGIAEAYEAFVACHQAQSPLNTVVNAHIHATLPNFLIQECFDDFLEPWSMDIFVDMPRVVNGYIEVPNKPGLGIDLNEEEMAKHPYGQDNFLRLFEDGWETRDREI